MIDEKKLVKALKSAAKAGYNLFVTEGKAPLLYLFTPDWLLRLPMRELPRAVLALIVEHTGRIPEPGDCSAVYADGEQAILPEPAQEEIARRETGDVLDPVRCVPLRWGPRVLYQSAGSLRVWSVMPGALTLIAEDAERKFAEILGGDRMLWRSDDTELIVPCYRADETAPDGVRAIWAALESVKLSNEE